MRRAFIAVSLLAALTEAHAQCKPGGPPNLPPRPRALIGVVMDSLHRPLENADVFINRPSRRTRTGADGRFALDTLPIGVVRVTVRRLGYEMAVQDYEIVPGGSHARFCLVADPQRLLPMISSARRLGLGGVVGDSTLQPLAGAQVRVLAGGEPAITDSAGGFFIPLKPGPHAVIVSKEGFGRQLLSVTIPKDSGREVAVWLGAPPRNPNRLFVAYEDMRTRLQIRNANRSALLSPEDISKKHDPFFAAQSAIRANMNPAGCMAIIDGGPYELPVASIPKEDIAAMEIYLHPRRRSTPTSISSAGTAGGSALSTTRPMTPTCGGGDGLLTLYVWLK